MSSIVKALTENKLKEVQNEIAGKVTDLDHAEFVANRNKEKLNALRAEEAELIKFIQENLNG